MVYLDSLRNNIRRRTETDYIMPIWLPFVPLILVLLGGMILAVSILGGMRPVMGRPFRRPVTILSAMPLVALMYIIGAIINLYVLYKWIKRRNEHFKRQLMVYRDIISLLREISRERGIDISAQIALVNREISEAEIKETKKNAVLWAILVLLSGNWISPILPPICMVILYVYPVLPPIGIVNLYIYHFLTKDFFVHERREDRIVTRIQEALGILGTRFAYRRYYEIPHRNTILYAILTIITLGIFSLYWIYVITKDQNEHFLEQRRWEDAVVSAIEQLTLPSPS